MKRIFMSLIVVLFLTTWGIAFESSIDKSVDQVKEPLYVGLLIQDNLSAMVPDMDTYREFVRSLPSGAHVAIAYARPGSIRMAQTFTDDLEAAVEALRSPTGSPNMAPASPFVAAREFMRTFPSDQKARKILLFASDGLDALYGEVRGGYSSNPYLSGAAKFAEQHDIAVYTIFVPSRRPHSFRSDLISLGQGTLNYLSRSTGGIGFYSGSSYVSAEPYLLKLREQID